MSRTVGPILATGAMTVVNQTVFNDKKMDWRVPIATGLAAVGFSLVEKAAPELAVIIAWTTFLTVLLTRTDPKIPSPVESAAEWWKKGQNS
jgi:hypothetical protein